MMRITESWIDDAPARALFAAFDAAGFEAFFVGGCVRNALLGEQVSDLDLATAAHPDAVFAAAEAAGLTAIGTGIEHGTVTVLAENVPFEVTTFRRDVSTDGRRATVAFATDMAEDARRRDFTMNAIYADRNGAVIDPLDGLDDLKAHRLRFIGEPEDRIREDYLRSLRYFRFHAAYADREAGFDPEALAAIAETLDGLESLSRERVGSEILKLLAAPDPAPEVAVMGRVGVFVRLLPGAASEGLAPLIHLEQEYDVAPDAIRRLAMLGGEDVRTQLRLSRVDAARRRVIRDLANDGLGLAEAAYHHGADAARDAALVRAASLNMHPLDGWQDEIAKGAAATFPISAADLMPDFEGPALGAELKRLEKLWVTSGFTLTRDDLLKG